jgi:hypothetical protein
MTSPITEPPTAETANLTATNTFPAAGGTSTEETEAAEVPGPPTDASAFPEAATDGASELPVDETPDQGALSVPDDQPEEQWSASPDAEHEQVPTRDSRVDMRIGRNYGLAVGQWYEAIQRYSGAELTKEWRAGELKDYVQIANETELLNLLRDKKVLVLHAKEPGSGRWTAALRLLSKFENPQLTIRRIQRETSTSFSISGLRGHRNTGWILDLRDPDESISANGDLGHELLQIGDLDADGSHLVVLVGTGLWERIGRGAEKLAHTVEFPGPLKLCSALLDSSKVTKADAWAEKFRQGVEPLSSAKIFTWSRVFASSYREFETKNGRSPLPDVEKDVEEIAKIVRSAASGWMETLTAWHIEPGRTSYDRNYLLLAAVYDGAPIEFVHRKIASLAEALGEKGEQAEPLEGQQGPGLVQLARQINAELLPDGSLRFPGPGFAEAVVRYFWIDRPHLVNDFMKWTVGLTLVLGHEQGSQIAERMVPWVLHQAQAAKSTQLLRLVVTEWSQDENLAVHAHDLLVMACLDQQIGSRSRKAISTWPGQKETGAYLLKTLARVFATLAPAHKQMLGRLGEIASSSKAGVPEAVGEAVHDLWVDEEFRSTLSDTLTSWFEAEQEQLRRAATSAFLQLASQRNSEDDLILLPELRASDWITRGWRAVLEERQPGQLAHQAFEIWLDTAATAAPSTSPIFDTLANAVHDTPGDDLRGRRHLNLVRLGERWVLQSNVLDEQERSRIRYELEGRTQFKDPHRPTSPAEEESPVA